MREPTAAHVPAQFVRLLDGRGLAYAEYGDPNGHPTLYFHGLPGSRLEAVLAAKSAAEAGIRLIASDRPGIGGSDPQDGRTLLDWPADVLQLADHIGLARFAVVGVSGGGPYAAVCAHAIPERLDGVAIVSGVAPFGEDGLLDHMVWFNKLAVRVAQVTPSLITNGLRPAAIMRWFPRLAIDLLSRSLDTPDREVLARTEVKEAIARSLSDSLRQGARANARELVILARPWGFRLEDILSDIYLWHGGQDRVVPASHGRSLCRKLSRAHFELLAAEGHFSLVIDHVADIFSRINSARLASPGHSPASASGRLEE
jgi:pimeloyl-ACP methyl ester carboxylesterase